MSGAQGGYVDASLMALFAQEAEAQAELLADGLLVLEQRPADGATLEQCMRAAHSLKGAARIVGVEPGVQIAHVMEECFVRAQHGEIELDSNDIDALLRGVDLLKQIGRQDAMPEASQIAALSTALAGGGQGSTQARDAEPLADSSDAPRVEGGSAEARPAAPRAAPGAGADRSGSLSDASAGPPVDDAERGLPAPGPAPDGRRGASAASDDAPPGFAAHESEVNAAASAEINAEINASSAPTPLAHAGTPVRGREGEGEASARARPANPAGDRALRVDAGDLDRLLNLSGQSLVEARRLESLGPGLSALQRGLQKLELTARRVRSGLAGQGNDYSALEADDLLERIAQQQAQLASLSESFERGERRQSSLALGLHEQALALRMRPLSDLTHAFPRMMRDLSRTLGKPVDVEIIGEQTRVDRDILARLEAPLGHLLRNALDHGIEPPALRAARGKAPTGRIVLSASHVAGALTLVLSDDGGGVDLDAVRQRVVARGLADASLAAGLSEAELLEFLFLPGFSLRDTVTDVSGRGVGLDVVQTTLRQVHGSLRIQQVTGQGTRFTLQLPLTLSLMRCLIAEVGGAPIAFPLMQLQHTLQADASAIATIEGREYVHYQGRPVALVSACDVFGGTAEAARGGPTLPVILIGNEDSFGLVVERFIGERMLVVQPLDPRLGKIKDVAAVAILENGDPVLVADIDDLMHSLSRLSASGRFAAVLPDAREAPDMRGAKRILVVDDSLTIRELERKLLGAQGYEVSVAVDGLDGLETLRSGDFDLVVTDVDMPRMDGIALVEAVRRDKALARLPVMIVSYKDRPEDRQRGLEAGADHYLAKGSFHDAGLLDAVRELIGEARE